MPPYIIDEEEVYFFIQNAMAVVERLV